MFKKARFSAHYREHYPRILGLCRHLLGADTDAEDAAQEVFTRGYEAYPRFRENEPFGPWISTLARNHCIDRLRQSKRLADQLGSVEETPDDLADEGPTAVGALISAHTAGAINTAIAALPEQYRVPLVLAYYADASYADIAASLNTNRNRVGVLLLRAKQRLRTALATQEKIP